MTVGFLLTLQVSMMAQNWPAGVTFVESKANDSVIVSGDLATVKIIEDLSCASSSSNACFTGLQFNQYMGNHVFFATPPRPPIRQALFLFRPRRRKYRERLFFLRLKAMSPTVRYGSSRPTPPVARP